MFFSNSIIFLHLIVSDYKQSFHSLHYLCQCRLINSYLIQWFIICYYHYCLAHCMACGILVPRTGMEPRTPTVEAWNLNHWISPVIIILMFTLTRFCLRCPFKLAFMSFWHVFPTVWKRSYDQPRQHIEMQRHYFANKGPSSQGYGFSSSHVWMDYKESWVQKNWSFWTVVLEKTLESPLDCKETQPVHPKENQSWIIIERTDVEAETPILWPPDAKSWLIWKDPDAGKNWRWEKGMIEDEMVGWHQRLNGHEFE